MSTAQNSGTKVITLKNGRTRRFRSKLERRQIVEETLKPGASVALIARAHDVNTNQVFKWRKQYEQGRLEKESPPTLLPVRIAETNTPARASCRTQPSRRKFGIIDIDLGHARVRIEGAGDPECVRVALESLVR
jgi:transposase